MIACPHQSADDTNHGKWQNFGQLWNEKPAPADFFAERAPQFRDQPHTCGDENEQGQRYASRKTLPPEIFGDLCHGIPVKRAEPGHPGDHVNRQRIKNRDQITEPDVTRVAPPPGQFANGLAKIFFVAKVASAGHHIAPVTNSKSPLLILPA